MWQISTRVLKSTACLLAVLCFVFVRTTSLIPDDSESLIKACSEILHVCMSGAPEVLLESKTIKLARIDSPECARFCLTPVDDIAHRFERRHLFSKADIVESKQPLWLINQALLI
ncbi:MAG: hypothetical protein DKT66_09140 [Candidatus Melainabacteria bacterium]|nr:MAG: hypothetical protein DKT66_09140 [Candidatus Melainabacteria bacterium]